MLGYLAAGFFLGAVKALAYGAKRDAPLGHTLLGLGPDALAEEVTYRFGVERMGLRSALGVDPEKARVVAAALFGLGHKNPVDAAVGGYLYSRAYDAGGLPLATLAHVAHNLGVVVLSK